VLDGDPVETQSPQQPLPTFRPMSIVAKRSPISATAELVSILIAIVSLRRDVAINHKSYTLHFVLTSTRMSVYFGIYLYLISVT